MSSGVAKYHSVIGGPLSEGTMRWRVWHGDILDVPADILICSANVYLTLSGGVGGAFLLRYGPEMQENLRQYLTARGVRHVPRGSVVEMPPCGSPYRAVLARLMPILGGRPWRVA